MEMAELVGNTAQYLYDGAVKLGEFKKIQMTENLSFNII